MKAVPNTTRTARSTACSRRTSQPLTRASPRAGGLFFANADAVRKHVQSHAREGTKAIVLDAETVPFIDLTAAQMLAELAEELDRRGVRFLLARDIGQVRDVLGRADADTPVQTFPTVQAAVDSIRGAGGPRA